MISIFLSIILLLVLTSVASAQNLGTISHWYSDDDRIGRWKTSRVIYRNVLDDSMTFVQIEAYVDNARNQWANANITSSITNSKSSSSIEVYGGTYRTLKNVLPTLRETDSGRASLTHNQEGTWRRHLDENHYKDHPGYVVTKVLAVVVYRSGKSSSGYRSTTMHELGHCFGWYGHSSNRSDVMYGTENSVTTITDRDKNHIKQVY